MSISTSDILNHISAIHTYSLAAYLRWTAPYFSPEQQEERDTLDVIIQATVGPSLIIEDHGKLLLFPPSAWSVQHLNNGIELYRFILAVQSPHKN